MDILPMPSNIPSDTDPDLAEQLVAVRRQRAAQPRRRRWRESQLDRHDRKLTELHRAGASLAELRTWLRRYQHITVSRSTISRWLSSRGIRG